MRRVLWSSKTVLKWVLRAVGGTVDHSVGLKGLAEVAKKEV